MVEGTRVYITTRGYFGTVVRVTRKGFTVMVEKNYRGVAEDFFFSWNAFGQTVIKK